MSPVKVGFIGCGPFSYGAIYPCLQRLCYPPTRDEEPLGELVAVCDQKEDLARRNARAFGFQRVYTDYHAMLEKEDLDLVFVVMHPRNQPRIAIDVLNSGRHVYVEKPPATTLEEVQAMKEASDRSGKYCQVGFMKRFSEPFVRAKAIMALPAFGRPSVYESRKARSGPYYPIPVYHFLNGFVCHHIDLARYFMGPVESVYAEMVDRSEPDVHGYNQALLRHDDLYSNYYDICAQEPHIRQADGYLMLFRFTSGAIGVHNANTLERAGNTLERVTVTGEGSVVVVEDWWRLKANLKNEEQTRFWEPLTVDGGSDLAARVHGYLGEVREFLTAAREGRKPAVTIDDGVACLRIEQAIRLSIKEGRRVAISEIKSTVAV